MHNAQIIFLSLVHLPVFAVVSFIMVHKIILLQTHHYIFIVQNDTWHYVYAFYKQIELSNSTVHH